MTVAELIAKLQAMPQDAYVYKCYHDTEFGEQQDDITAVSEGYFLEKKRGDNWERIPEVNIS